MGDAGRLVLFVSDSETYIGCGHQREDQGLNHRHEHAEQHQRYGHEERHEREEDAHDGVVGEHVRHEANRQRHGPDEVLMK